MLRNELGIIVVRHIGTRGHIECFKTFGAIVILYIGMKLKIGNNKERLDAIAQVIAECDGMPDMLLCHNFCRQAPEWVACDLNNTKHGFSLPIYCILCDGLSFEFFKFERMHVPSFLHGCVVGDPRPLRRGLQLPDFDRADTTFPFILHPHPIYETVFDTMLCAYISGLKAYQSKGSKDMEGLGLGWDEALKSVEDALATFRKAESQCHNGDLDAADVRIQEGHCPALILI